MIYFVIFQLYICIFKWILRIVLMNSIRMYALLDLYIPILQRANYSWEEKLSRVMLEVAGDIYQSIYLCSWTIITLFRCYTLFKSASRCVIKFPQIQYAQGGSWERFGNNARVQHNQLNHLNNLMKLCQEHFKHFTKVLFVGCGGITYTFEPLLHQSCQFTNWCV